MKNSVTLQIIFSYQGVTYTPTATILLDRYLEKSQPIPDFFPIVAKENKIDSYSYEYEVMETGQYRYLSAEGLAKQFCSDDHFDVAGFEAQWRQLNIENKLTEIAEKNLKINDLSNNKALRRALLEAYQLGVAQTS